MLRNNKVQLVLFQQTGKYQNALSKVYPLFQVFNVVVHTIGAIFISITYGVLRRVKAKIDRGQKIKNQWSCGMQQAGIDNM